MSGLLSPQGAPATVLRSVVAGSAAICFDERILSEYRRVLATRKFGFDADRVAVLLEFLKATGQSVLVRPSRSPFQTHRMRRSLKSLSALPTSS